MDDRKTRLQNSGPGQGRPDGLLATGRLIALFGVQFTVDRYTVYEYGSGDCPLRGILMARLRPAGCAGPSRTNPLPKPNLAAIFLIVRNILDTTSKNGCAREELFALSTFLGFFTLVWIAGLLIIGAYLHFQGFFKGQLLSCRKIFLYHQE